MSSELSVRLFVSAKVKYVMDSVVIERNRVAEYGSFRLKVKGNVGPD